MITPERVIYIDPGMTTGVAHVTLSSYEAFPLSWDADQFTDPEEAFEWVDGLASAGAVLGIENYLSAGHLTKEAKHTIKVIGFFEFSYRGGLHVELTVPQKRKPFVSQALKLISNRDIPGPHSADALAHAIAYMRRIGVQSSISE